MRLYVDDAHIADATVENGRWLVEGGPVLDAPSQRIRVDLLQPGTASVAARAEVDFVVDLPADAEPVAVAQAEADAPAVQSAPAGQPAAAAEPVQPPAADEPAMPEPTSTEPTSTEPATSEPATSEPATATPTVPTVDPVIPPAPREPAATPAEPETDAPAPAATEAPAEPAVPTLVAVSVGDPEAQRFAAGKAIIRRGDNLWTIARRVYGEGIKYTTIYQANTGQIRDPDRIYPGQVFDLPEQAQ